MTTIREIATKAGVSHMTVSNVLNGRIKGARPDAAARAQRIRQLADEMGYRPHAAARSMSDGRTRTVAVAIRDERFGYDALLGINRVLEKAGYVLALVPMDDIVGDDQPTSRLFHERMVDAVAVLSCSPDDLERLDERLPDLCDRTIYVDTNRYESHGCIRRDEAHAGALAVNELHRMGFRDIAYIDRPDEVLTYCFAERRGAAARRCDELGTRFTRYPLPLLERGKIGPAAAGRLADEIESDATALLAADASLARVIELSWGRKRRVAGLDYALVCCDETAEESLLWPELSRVSFDRTAMGQQAGRMLLQLLETGHRTPSRKVTGHWVPGNTACVV